MADERCGRCMGEGWLTSWEDRVRCPECKDKPEAEPPVPAALPKYDRRCPACDGTGITREARGADPVVRDYCCRTCDGRASEDATAYVHALAQRVAELEAERDDSFVREKEAEIAKLRADGEQAAITREGHICHGRYKPLLSVLCSACQKADFQVVTDAKIEELVQRAREEAAREERERCAKALQPWIDEPGKGMRAGPGVPPSIRMWAKYMQDEIRRQPPGAGGA